MDSTADTAPAGSLTRGQVAARLGISVAGVRRREGKSLHPAVGLKGERLFSEADVEAERRRMAEQGPAPVVEAALDDEPDVEDSSPPAGDDEGMADVPADIVSEPARVAPGQKTRIERIPVPVQPTVSAPDATPLVFKELNAGKKLRDIVAQHGLSPEVVKQAHEAWTELSQIDALSCPAGERRLFRLERVVEVHKDATDAMLEEIRSVRRRVDHLEKG